MGVQCALFARYVLKYAHALAHFNAEDSEEDDEKHVYGHAVCVYVHFSLLACSEVNCFYDYYYDYLGLCEYVCVLP